MEQNQFEIILIKYINEQVNKFSESETDREEVRAVIASMCVQFFTAKNFEGLYYYLLTIHNLKLFFTEIFADLRINLLEKSIKTLEMPSSQTTSMNILRKHGDWKMVCRKKIQSSISYQNVQQQKKTQQSMDF